MCLIIPSSRGYWSNVSTVCWNHLYARVGEALWDLSVRQQHNHSTRPRIPTVWPGVRPANHWAKVLLLIFFKNSPKFESQYFFREFSNFFLASLGIYTAFVLTLIYFKRKKWIDLYFSMNFLSGRPNGFIRRIFSDSTWLGCKKWLLCSALLFF